MILVTTGTQKYQFQRLINYILKLVEKENIKEQIYIQSGYTKIDKKKIQKNIIVQDFFENFDELISTSDIIITHGGVGSIINSLNKNKKIIAIPRKAEYKEHIDNHQEEIVQKLTNSKYILSFNNYNELQNNYLKIKNNQITLQKFISNNKKFNENLYDLIEGNSEGE